MRIRWYAVVAAAGLCIATASSGAVPISSAAVYGVWLNPHGSVKVQTKSCGPTLCGSIVWANSEAISDARDAGVSKLIGIQLLSGYRLKSPGLWQGRAYVPDMGRTFYSRIEQTAPDRLKISGCILGGLICKSQIWTRV